MPLDREGPLKVLAGQESLNRRGAMELGFERCIGVGWHRGIKVFWPGNAKSLKVGHSHGGWNQESRP